MTMRQKLIYVAAIAVNVGLFLVFIQSWVPIWAPLVFSVVLMLVSLSLQLAMLTILWKYKWPTTKKRHRTSRP